MIDFKNLTKQQQQYLVLGLIVVAAVLYGGSLLVGALLKADKKSRAELDELTVKIDRAEALLRGGLDLYKKLESAESDLDKWLRLVPEHGDEYIWATERVSELIRGTGIVKKSVEEISAAAPAVGVNGASPLLGSYAVRVVATGGYAQLCHFLDKVGRESSLATVQQLDISGGGSSPETHNLKIDLCWPKLPENGGVNK
jgi:hypothetical protein